MARTIQQIFSQTVTQYVAAAVAAGITTIIPSQWSDYDLQQLILNSCATAIAIFENILDVFTAEVEAIVASASPQTPLWLQNQMFLFQYNATDPQIIQFDGTGDNPTFAPFYTTVNDAYKIITSCSVVHGGLGTTTIKTAKGGTTPIPLTTPELDAAQSYANTLTVPGVIYNVISLDSDKLYAAMTVKYIGQYSAIIQATVVAAIEAYLLGIPFNGNVSMDALIQAVLAVPGVTECILNNVSARPDAVAFGSGTPLVTGNAWIQNSYPTASGYITGENTPGSELTDTITYIPV